MRPILSSLLIPLVLISQSFCAAHSHAGTPVIEPEGHSARPHIHLHGGNHHHHSHGDHHRHDPGENPSSLPGEHVPLDHGSDAVYIAETQLFNDAKPAKVAKAEWIVYVVADEADAIAELHFYVESDLPPPLRRLKCPIYLRTLSIRC